MSYRKFTADFLFTGNDILNNTHVLITKTNGEILSVVNKTEAGNDVEVFKGIITPGFVNAHCHLELSHMKGLIPEKTGLVDFVYKIVTGRHFFEEEILSAINKAEADMLQNGIVAAGDICNNLLTAPVKQKANIAYYNFIETSGWLPALAKSRFERSKILYDEFIKISNDTSIVPHAPYSVSDDLWQNIIPFFENKTVSIHNQETAHEDEFFFNGTGDLVRMYEMMKIDNSFFVPAKKSSLQSCFQKLQKAASIIFVHNTFTNQADIEFVLNNKKADQQIFFCLCPNANLYIENTLPPVEMLLKNNCNIILGSDSLASNHQLNILEEIKTLNQYLPHLSLNEMLRWATLNGAKALQMDNILGSFESGKKPGIVLIENIDKLELKADSFCRRIL